MFEARSAIRDILGLLTEDELAEGLGIKVSTVGFWRYKRIGPKHIRLGKNVYYRVRDVQEWIDEQAISTYMRADNEESVENYEQDLTEAA